jgi:hypothetical protein
MAKDSTTSARDFLFAEGSRGSSPRLSDWLIKDVRGARTSTLPPPPLENDDLATTAEDAPPAEAVAPQDDASPALHSQDDAPSEGADGDAAEVDDEQRESMELEESLSYARAYDVPEADADVARELGAEDASPVSPQGVYASASDWLDDDDAETTAFFAAAPEAMEDDAAPDDEAASQEAPEGTSLSPQVLTPEEESDDAVAFVVPGTAGTNRWKAAAAIGAALLLGFLIVHRLKPAPRVAAASKSPSIESLTSPVSETNAVSPATTEEDDSPAPKSAHGGGLADGLGRSHGSSADPTPPDPALPGGPSVARFPDLPREILNQLAKAFETEEGEPNKAPADAVERYTR